MKHLNTRNFTYLALLFHGIGLGLVLVRKWDWFRLTTPFHLLLMAALLVLAFRKEWQHFAGWLLLTALLGFVAEYIGIHTSLLFGHYQYGSSLGQKLNGVPLLIGLNWVTVLAGSLSLSAGILKKALVKNGKLWTVAMAAAMATAYDWVLEPVAVKLGWWSWQGGIIPVYNYVCWFGLSLVIGLLWQQFRLRANHFAVNLLLVQLVFFALLRLVL